MPELTDDQKQALAHARHLAENGVPIFLARPAMHLDPADGWDPAGGHQGTGYKFPRAWQLTKPDPTVVDRWRPGMALCAVMGHAVDGVDFDPRNGGSPELLAAELDGQVPRRYGRQSTPSGGSHWLVAPLGVHSRKGVLDGVDVKAGVDGDGLGFLFLAPTVKLSKATGELGLYEWDEAPDITLVSLLGADGTGDALAARVLAVQGGKAYGGPTYAGPTYDDLTPVQQAWADRERDRVIAQWREKLAEAETWPDGRQDDAGRGWEALASDWVWVCARLAATPWMKVEDPQGLHDEVLPPGIAGDEVCKGKWRDTLLAKAAARPIESPPWAGFEDDPPAVVDVTNEAEAMGWLKAELGRGQLSGVFRRGQELVHTPRVGERGYVAPKDERDNAGPAQVRRIEPLELAARIDHGYTVIRGRAPRVKRCVFPQAHAARAAASLDLLPNIRDLAGVTHTPVIRADGSVLDAPGYDQASGMLYLPLPGLEVPRVSAAPTPEEVQRAGQLVLTMLADFPFITPHDRANYIGALLTPALRPLVPPPYKLVLIDAPQRGSGKTLLARIVVELHGGVFKSEFPSEDNELRKFITSTLDATTSPVVLFDNIAGVLKSSVLDGLLTSSEWSDRPLGRTDVMRLSNDRLWMATGNNIHIGGDLERRTVRATINANMERPEERDGFTIPDLEVWVRQHRGELLWALLTLIRCWVVAGAVEAARPTSDSFGRWVAVLRGILNLAGLGDTVGVVGHADTVQGRGDPEDEEWAVFLAAAHRLFGSEPWTAREALNRWWDLDDPPEEQEARWLRSSELPGDIGEKARRSKDGAAKSLGKWLSFRDGRWAGSLSVQSVPVAKGHTKTWRIVTPEGGSVPN